MTLVSAVNVNMNQKGRFNDWKTANNIAYPISEKNMHRIKHGHNKDLKLGVLGSSMLGVTIALATIAKKQKFSLNPEKIINTPTKDWAIFKIKKTGDREPLKIHEKEILGIAAGSVLGGFTGGAVFDDKKHIKAKAREAINQFIGAVTVPVIFVSLASNSVNKFMKLAETPSDKFKTLSNWAEKCKGNKKLLNIVQVTVGAIGLGIGIVAGNKFSNFMNEKIFKREVDRDIKAADFAPHLDDVGLAITLMSPKSLLGSVIARVIPIALTVPGYETGITKHGQYDKKK